MKKTRRLVLLALMISQALVLTVVEAWIPVPVAIYGVKLGLANIVTIVAISFWGLGDALLVVVLRCILAALFASSPSVLIFSLSGGILSTLVMAFLHKRLSKVFSILGISVAGSVMHNVGQLAAASLVMKELSVFSYLPVLLVSGIIMGCFVGLSSNLLIHALRKTNIFNS